MSGLTKGKAQMATAMYAPGPDTAMTVDEYLRWLAPRIWEAPYADSQWLLAPADIFGIVVSLLRRSGSYRLLVQNWPPPVAVPDLDTWLRTTMQLATRWREAVDNAPGIAIPGDVQRWWSVLRANAATAIADIQQRPDLQYALLQLASTADQVFSDFLADGPFGHSRLLRNAKTYVTNHGTLCTYISPSRFRVIPKAHPPQYGLTPRSLSHYLSLCQGVEIGVEWYMATEASAPRTDRCNMLLIPFPFSIDPAWFRAKRIPNYTMPSEFAFFGFERPPGRANDFSDWIAELLQEALRQLSGEPIDLIVFPECSLTESEYRSLIDHLVEADLDAAVIAGVAGSGSGPSQWLTNTARLNLLCLGGRTEFLQHKHHRWLLNEPQISQYRNLAGSLPCASGTSRYWEAIEIHPRLVQFVQIANGVTVCTLVCEDLSRADPVGELLRGVAPNLVVALLQDGAQMERRWPGKYAASLAEDPGCSVLTMSSAGMVELSALQIVEDNRSRPADQQWTPNYSVALWKENGLRPAKELPLLRGEDGSSNQAIILKLGCVEEEAYCADGRPRRVRRLSLGDDPNRIVRIKVHRGPPT